MTIGGVPISALAERFGTPCFVYDAERIRQNIGRVQQAFAAHYAGDHKLYYAVKTNENPVIMALLRDCGAGMDTASVNEIKLARHIGVQRKDIMFSGNFLSDDDIREGLASGVVMNLDDGELLSRVLALGTPNIISFRVNPGIGKSNVGHYDITGGPAAKFGIHPDHVVDCYRAAQAAGIRRFGVHMMAGSCVTDAAYFKEITERLFAILATVHQELGITFEFVDLGGGLGIPYRPGEAELDIDAAIHGVAEAITKSCAQASMPLPRIVMEPGRYFVGDAGYLVGRVQFVKESYRRIVGTDLGMNIVPRVVLYGAYHHLRVPGKEHLPTQPTNLCGQICEQTDLWAEDRPLPPLEVGDLVVMENAGAYCYGMSYRYNGRLLPAEVLVDGGEAYLIREAEPFEEMLRGVQFPPGVLSSSAS